MFQASHVSSPSSSPETAVATGADCEVGLATAVMKVVGTELEAAGTVGTPALELGAGTSDDAGVVGDALGEAGAVPDEPPFQTSGPGAA